MAVIAQLQLVRVHEQAEVESIIDAARSHADDSGHEGREWAAIFATYCDLMAKRIPVAPQSAPTIDLSSWPPNVGGGG